jgi:CBS domain-containing protein
MNADVTVREVMDREYVGVSESDDLVDTVELMLRQDADTALVLRGQEPVGVLTDRDVLALVVEGPAPAAATVADAMTASIPTVDATVPLPDAADRMSAQSARRLVVTDPTGEEALGIITEHDLLASSTHGTGETTPAAEATVGIEAGPGSAMAAETETEAEDRFQDQGICERCGTLTGDLTGLNGQLLCADCRDI